MLLACYSHKHISYRIRTIIRKAITLVVTNLEGFSSSINSSLNNADWLTKRDIIRTLVKRIEINFEDVNIVFRVKELPDSFHWRKINACNVVVGVGMTVRDGMTIRFIPCHASTRIQ